MKCKAMTANKTPCRAQALKGGDRCFIHAPETGHARAAARKLGGENRHTQHFAEAPELQDRAVLDDLQKVWVYAMRELFGHDNSIVRSRAIFQGIEIGKGLFEVGELESRIAVLEQRAK